MVYKRLPKRPISETEPSNKNDKVFDIGKKKQITVRQFNKTPLVDIREFYESGGELRPGKKGISLTESSWSLLLSNANKINKALKELNPNFEPPVINENGNDIQSGFVTTGSHLFNENDKEDLEPIKKKVKREAIKKFIESDEEGDEDKPYR